MIYGVGPTDPLTFAGFAVLLSAVRRAPATSPIGAPHGSIPWWRSVMNHHEQLGKISAKTVAVSRWR